MNLLDVIRKNRIFFIILVLGFSLSSLSPVYLPHSLSEVYDGCDYDETMIKSSINNKLVLSLRKLLQKLRTFIIKKVRVLSEILSHILISVNIRIALFAILFSKVQILHLKSVLCFYFHGGKFKDNSRTLISWN